MIHPVNEDPELPCLQELTLDMVKKAENQSQSSHITFTFGRDKCPTVNLS